MAHAWGASMPEQGEKTKANPPSHPATLCAKLQNGSLKGGEAIDVPCSSQANQNIAP